MYTAVIILILFIAALLVVAILAQSSKGGGVTSQFSGATQMMGTKKTTDLLEKITWGFAAAIVFLSLSTTFLVDKTGGSSEGPKSVNIEKAKEKKGLNQGINPNQAPKKDAKESKPSKTEDKAKDTKTTSPSKEEKK